MEKLNNLRLTKTELDTSMAQEYINKINESSEWPDNGEFLLEIKPNEICKYQSLLNIITSCSGYEPGEGREKLNMLDVGKKLAMKIEENTEMFVQLEYLTRGTDPRDVRDGHIKIMYQITRCSDALWNPSKLPRFLHITETTPLYNLATIVCILYLHPQLDSKIKTFIMIDNKTMRPLGKFFMQLCHDVGLEVKLLYANPKDIELQILESWHWFERSESDYIGCTGVIAERSDLDSAIDTFIYSSVTAPWRLKQIYVQESVFEDFKETLAAKSNAVAGGDIVIGDKTFLIEHLGGEQTGIPTHAYRTTKELLALIETPYLSVWAAETALSHEIALRSSARTVWVNEYATFYGPPRSALSVFNLSVKCSKYEYIDITKYEKLTESLKPWAQLKTAERFEVIVDAIKASKDEDIRNDLSDFALQWRSEDVLHVTEKTVCFGIQNQMGIVAVSVLMKESMPMFLKALINGNAAAILVIQHYHVFIKELQELGVPIQGIQTDKINQHYNNCEISCPIILEQLKVIRTNYGTIFAN